MYISMSDINVDYNLEPDNISMLVQSHFAIWVVLKSLTNKSQFPPPKPPPCLVVPARPRSPWTPTTWSTGWRTSTRRATIRCWRGRRRSSAGPRRVRSGRWLQRPRALWSWSSWCPSAPWSPETGEAADGWIPLTGSPPLLVYLLSEISFITHNFIFQCWDWIHGLPISALWPSGTLENWTFCGLLRSLFCWLY